MKEMEIKIDETLNETLNGVLKNVLTIDPQKGLIAETVEKNSIPGDVYHRLSIQFDLPWPVAPWKLERFLEGNLDYFQKISEGFHTDWDGNNHVGIWPNINYNQEYEFEYLLNTTADLSYEYAYETPGELVNEYFAHTNTSGMDIHEIIDDIMDIDLNEAYVEFTREQVEEEVMENHLHKLNEGEDEDEDE